MSNPSQATGDPFDLIGAAFRQVEIPARPSDFATMARIESLQREGVQPVLNQENSGDKKMRFRVFIWIAIAAAVVAGLGTMLPSGTTSLALADVIKATQNHSLVKYKVVQTSVIKEAGTEEPVAGAGESVMYADLRAPRYRQETNIITLNRAVEEQTVQIRDGVKNRYLQTNTGNVIPGADDDADKSQIGRPFWAKRYREMYGQGRREAFVGPVAEGYDPVKRTLPLLESLRDLAKRQNAVITNEKLAGKTVVRYYVEEDQKTTRLWVDANTKLPVLVEFEFVGHTPKNPLNKWVYSDFQWDPQLKGVKDADELFDTTPPNGYKLTDHTKTSQRPTP